MNVLFFSTATNNIGETYTIGKFAKELTQQGHSCKFVAPVLGEKFLLSMGFNQESIFLCSRITNSIQENTNYRKLKGFVDSFKTDIAIVADWHEYNANGTSNNNSYSLNWLNESIKLGTFDHFGYAPDGITTQLYKNGHESTKAYQALPNRYSFVIKPCPHHDNLYKSKDNIFYWGLVKNQKLTKQNKLISNIQTVRIILPIGFWQESLINKACEQHGIHINYYSDVLIPIIIEVLAEFKNRFQLLVLARSNKKEQIITNYNVEIVNLPPQNPVNFELYLKSCHILLTDNLLSSNIGKALNTHLIPVVLQNSENSDAMMQSATQFKSKTQENLHEMLEHKLIPIFKSFPLGLNDLPEITKNDNKFLNCFLRQEVFNKNKLKETIKSIIENSKEVQDLEQAKNLYLKKNSELLTAEGILKEVI